MERLLNSVRALKKGPVAIAVRRRMGEFRKAQASSGDIFSELCFCILTANYSAEGGIRIQKALRGHFHRLSERQLASRLRNLGHRFPNTRARYIRMARSHRRALPGRLRACAPATMRQWLADNVHGLGYKEASHFLRNVGITDLAIIDFHIVDLLVRHGLITRPRSKSLTRKKYLQIEAVLEDLAARAHMSLAELDLYLWYLETGKILK